MQKVFSNFCPFSGVLKLFGKVLNNRQIFSRCSSPCMFSTENDLRCMISFISSSVLKIYQKIQKCLRITFYSHFRPSSGALKLLGEILKNHQILSSCSTLCILSTEKDVQVVLFHFSPKKLLENANISSDARIRPEKN